MSYIPRSISVGDIIQPTTVVTFVLLNTRMLNTSLLNFLTLALSR